MRPAYFDELFGKFRQINTHLTFLSSYSRHTIPLADLLATLNPEILHVDLQAIKTLLPEGDVTFEYVDENQVLLQHAEKVQYTSKGYVQHTAKPLDDVYEALANPQPKAPTQILIFEFCDVRTQGIGLAVKGISRKGLKRKADFFQASTKMGIETLSQEQLLAIVKGRNERFGACIDAYLASFDGEDGPAEALKTLIETCTRELPTEIKTVDPVVAMNARSVARPEGEKPDLAEMLEVLSSPPLFRGQRRHFHTLTAARLPRAAPLANELHPHLVEALALYKNVDAQHGLYVHQAQAVDAVMDGSHVIVTTSTSSGKSLVYQLPVLDAILRDHDQKRTRALTALLIFPTKALAQDQLRHLRELIGHIPTKRNIVVDTYDGDTTQATRRHVRRFADIVFTNPDAIHAAILPGQDWAEFLKLLRYVIVDELHVYRGTFGVHVLHVMARLNRLRLKYGPLPVYISCLATVAAPENHFRALCALSGDIVHVSDDGSPSAQKEMVVWEPPVLMNKKGQRDLPKQTKRPKKGNSSGKEDSPAQLAFLPRESPISELARILVQLLSAFPAIKAIVFCPIRAVCELLIKEVRTVILDPKHPEWHGLSEHDVMAYRGGYSKEDRRAIERKMFNGQLRAIVATNALELGIDLLDLDVVVSCGFPHLKLNLHQQFGRAGRARSSKGSLAVLVCGLLPIDRHYLNNSHELVEKVYEDLCVDGFLDGLRNRLVMAMHLQCAAFEWPIDDDDLAFFGKPEDVRDTCEQKLHKDNRGHYRVDPLFMPWPAEKVSLRAVELTMYAVVDITDGRNAVIEEVEELRTSFTLYEGGIFLHQGLPYLVKEFLPEGHWAKVSRVHVTWTTLQRDFSDVDPLEIELVKSIGGDIPVFYGKIQTTIIVFGFFKVSRKGEILEVVEVTNPPVLLRLKGFWIDIPKPAITKIKEKTLSPPGAIHAAQHAILNILPLFIAGGASTNPNSRFTPNDAEIATECKAPEKEFARRQSLRKRPARLIFHDSKGGEQGTGMSEKTFEYIDEILRATYKRVLSCDCEWGCPLCVVGTFCKESMLVMSKPGALIILAALLGHDLDELAATLPDGPEPNMPEIRTETITDGETVVRFLPGVRVIKGPQGGLDSSRPST